MLPINEFLIIGNDNEGGGVVWVIQSETASTLFQVILGQNPAHLEETKENRCRIDLDNIPK